MTNPVKLGNRCKTIDGERLSTNPKRVREHDSFSYCFFIFTEFLPSFRNEKGTRKRRAGCDRWRFFFLFGIFFLFCFDSAELPIGESLERRAGAAQWTCQPSINSSLPSFFFVIHSLVHSFGPRWRSRPFLIGRRRRLHLPNADGSLGPPSLGCQSLGYRVVTEFFFCAQLRSAESRRATTTRTDLVKKKTR